ncbi:MAG: pre-peptidase C-terminal domain-containing protein [Planctomycetes bacterium]|nr:pre-peptidase C-terminal domain-containing protein [Planctomycetota bacterium]
MRIFVTRTLALLACGLALAAQAPAKEIAVEDLTIAAGSSEAVAKYVPWSGIWWPQSEGLLSIGWNGTNCYRYDSTQKKYVAIDGVADNEASPLMKYDRFVEKRWGTNPGAALVELHGDDRYDFSHHVYGEIKERYDREGVNYSWWGHCNGWAAAAIMEKEPITSVTANGIRFEVGDLKGILTEVFFGSGADFTGTRYNKPSDRLEEGYRKGKTLLEKLNSNSPAPVAEYIDWYEKAYDLKMSETEKKNAKSADFKARLENFQKWYDERYTRAFEDLRPDAFHKILVSVIKNQKRALVFDITADEQVWNYPAFRYSTSVTASGTITLDGKTRKKWTVRTVVTYANDGVSESILGVNSFDKTYTYELYSDDAGKLVGGKWTGSSVSQHPDFAWLPTYNTRGRDTEENPNMEYQKVLALLSADHETSAASRMELKVKGTDGVEVGSASRVATNNSITWANPVRVGATAEVKATGTFTSTARKVVIAIQPVRSISGGNAEATREERTELATLTSANGWKANVTFPSGGKKLLVAQAFSASDALLSQDEIAVEVTSAPAGGDDRFEENDNQTAAKAVTAGTHANLYCGDDDFYKVALTASQSLEVKIVFQHSEGDIDMKLLDANGGTLASSGSTSNEETVRRAAGTAATAYVHVYGYSGAKAAYQMTVTVVESVPQPAPADDRMEENDTRETAKAVARGTHGDLKCNDDDWYSIQLSAGQSVTFTIDFVHSQGDLDITAHGPTGTQAGKSDGVTNTEKVTVTASAAGTYTLRVYGYSGAKNAYSLKVE